MRRSTARLLGLVATSSLAILWLIAAPTASAGDPCYHDFSMPTTSTQAATEIKLMPCAFAPTVANVPVGSKVTFFNGPDFVHLVTGANQSWGSRDVELQPGGTVSYTFDNEGIYPYACALHRGMSGAIVVGNAAAATGGGAAAGAGATTTGTTPATEETAAAGGLDGTAMLAIAVGVGLIVGVAAVVVALRRRRNDEEPASPQVV